MIQEFTNYLVNIKGYSSNTALAYAKDIRAFAKWMRQQHEDARWSAVKREHLDAYLTVCSAAGLRPSTTNRRLSAISALYNWMKRNGKDVDNPCKYESRRKIGKSIPNTINEQELKTAYEHAHGAARLMIGILATTGVRVQEMLDMMWEDIDFDLGSIKIKGKGAKERVVYSTAEVLAVLRGVTEYRSPRGRVFSIEQREARIILWRALKPYCRAKQLSPHAIRHTVATQLARNGANVTTIAAILGHERLETTQHYIDITQTDVRTTLINNAIV